MTATQELNRQSRRNTSLGHFIDLRLSGKCAVISVGYRLLVRPRSSSASTPSIGRTVGLLTDPDLHIPEAKTTSNRRPPASCRAALSVVSSGARPQEKTSTPMAFCYERRHQYSVALSKSTIPRNQRSRSR